jgi:DNA-binding NarL/FixJ family response regulator
MPSFDAPLHILLVEDSPTEAQRMMAILRNIPSLQAKVSWDTRLESAVMRLRNSRVDLVILDLLLPDSPWGQGLRRIRSVTSRVPIIVWTAVDDQFQALASLNNGASAYLTKDKVDPQIVSGAIDQAMGKAWRATLRAT